MTNNKNEGKIRDCRTPIYSIDSLLGGSCIICDSPEEAFHKAIDKSRIKMSNDLPKWKLQINSK